MWWAAIFFEETKSQCEPHRKPCSDWAIRLVWLNHTRCSKCYFVALPFILIPTQPLMSSTRVLLYGCTVLHYTRGADKSLARPGKIQANVSVRMAWISFDALPCMGKQTWWQLASRCCWNRARPWYASELVSFLVGLRTYQHPGIIDFQLLLQSVPITLTKLSLNYRTTALSEDYIRKREQDIR
jgi:hypothetical protein